VKHRPPIDRNAPALAYFAAIVATAAIAVGVWGIDRAERARFMQKNRADVLQQVSTVRAKLEGAINLRLSLARGLAAYTSTHPNLTQDDFAQLSRVMLAQQNGIRTVALTEGTILKFYYPLAGNERAIGIDLMDVAAQRAIVERTIDSGETVVAGPVNLVQGGVAFISRTPVFLTPANGEPESGPFFGLANIVIDRDELLSDAGLLDPATELTYALRGENGSGAEGNIFFGDETVFGQNPVVLNVSLPNGSWQIAAVPTGGWPQVSPNTLALRAGGSLLAVTCGVLAFVLVREPARLRQAVDRANAANAKLKAEIAERLRVEKALQDSQAHLEKAKIAAESANEAKSEFLANMSHELRTPLNGVLGYAQILQQDKSVTPQQRDGIEVIYQCGSHLLTLINDILDLSKIEARKLELYPHNVHFPSFLSSLAEIGRIKAEQKEIGFRYFPSENLPMGVQTDEKRLRQVLLNLLGNAIKFTDSGSVMLRVTVDGVSPSLHSSGVQQTVEALPPEYTRQSLNNSIPWQSQRNEGTEGESAHSGNSLSERDRHFSVTFEIEDTGVGMSVEQIDKIFLPFEQVGDNSRKAEGTGLGLAISLKIVQMMGSQLQVESELGRGSRFWFTIDLPLASEYVPPTAARSSQKIVGYRGDIKTILVVDDRWENRSIVRNVLEPLGFEVIEAENGKDGLEIARKLDPDVVITDLVMPILDGFEMTRQLRQDPQFQDTVIIASSASVFNFDREESRKAGCSDFLPKPISVRDLFDRLQEHLQLEWIEEGIEISEPETMASLSDDRTAIVPPSESELDALYDLARKGLIDEIVDRIDSLTSKDKLYEPFGDRVKELASQFQIKQIRNFINTLRESRKTQPEEAKNDEDRM